MTCLVLGNAFRRHAADVTLRLFGTRDSISTTELKCYRQFRPAVTRTSQGRWNSRTTIGRVGKGMTPLSGLNAVGLFVHDIQYT